MFLTSIYKLRVMLVDSEDSEEIIWVERDDIKKFESFNLFLFKQTLTISSWNEYCEESWDIGTRQEWRWWRSSRRSEIIQNQKLSSLLVWILAWYRQDLRELLLALSISRCTNINYKSKAIQRGSNLSFRFFNDQMPFFFAATLTLGTCS